MKIDKFLGTSLLGLSQLYPDNAELPEFEKFSDIETNLYDLPLELFAPGCEIRKMDSPIKLPLKHLRLPGMNVFLDTPKKDIC